MSGAEAIAAIQLVDACIGIAKSIIEIGHAVHDAQGLPPKLRDLLETLPMIEDLLKNAQDNLSSGRIAGDACQSAETILEQCEHALEELKELFRKACPKDGDNRGKRIWKGAKTVFFGRDSKVREYLEVIQRSLKLLEQQNICTIGDKLDSLQEATEALGSEDSGRYVYTGQGHMIVTEGGNPTQYIGGSGNSRQIYNPGVYNEAPPST